MIPPPSFPLFLTSAETRVLHVPVLVFPTFQGACARARIPSSQLILSLQGHLHFITSLQEQSSLKFCSTELSVR